MAKRMRIRAYAAVLSAVAVAAGVTAAIPAAQAETFPARCSDGWETTTVVEAAGELENLDSDGRGGFYVTGLMDGYLAHVDRAGRMEKLVTDLYRPAGVRLAGRYIYFLTGDGLSEPPGTLQRYDLETGAVRVLLTGLNGPNGLLLLRDGSLLFTTIGLGGSNGISRYWPETSEYERDWSVLPPANGLALAADGESVYVDTMTLQILRVRLDDPARPSVVSGLPELVSVPDDMEATRAGTLFVADHVLGAVYQVDTATGATCAIITGLIKPAPVRNIPDGATSVRIDHDGDSWALFVTSMDGALRRLRPPAGIDLTPATPARAG
ncbi:SMP-30/gluconolactonase/LRE family protein [Nocardia araoensis]|uniref:SMP-30/gluconolactonase/LRE family protein n=1 Tax=Nocardia araoensis TaxID=228600 RepID=UPI000A0657E7|nr:SMP-30/gluconolactonase/LRE family protein [Nocardia araoensis]